jgi:hypothetical protein
MTHARELETIRGATGDTGRNVDGWRYAQFGDARPIYTYYFSPDDSIVEWARVFVIAGYTPARVHEAFGQPVTTTYGDDLSKHESFKAGDVQVSYHPDGTANYIEYHPGSSYSIGQRRATRAQGVVDSVITEAVLQDHPGISEAVAADSVRLLRLATLRRALNRIAPAATRKPLPPLFVSRAARYDELCERVGCEAIRQANRAYDPAP